jgi:hypothetical protein
MTDPDMSLVGIITGSPDFQSLSPPSALLIRIFLRIPSLPVLAPWTGSGPQVQALLHSVAPASGVSPLPKAQGGPQEGRGSRGPERWRKK